MLKVIFSQGHTLGHALTSSFSGGNKSGDQPAQQQVTQERNPQNPCEYEMKQFLECAQNQTDVSLCHGFNEALKQCKLYYNSTSSAGGNTLVITHLNFSVKFQNVFLFLTLFFFSLGQMMQ